MAYRFRPGESTEREFERIAAEELDAALELLSSSPLPLDERVHETRKHLKKLRALLALGAGALDAARLDREKRSIRDAARAIADLRGGAALVEAFDALAASANGELGADVAARVREKLEAARVPGDGAAPALERAAALLRATRERLPELSLDRDDWSALEPGFRATYRRARDAGERARKRPDAEILHRFRTPAKRHFYQIHLLEDVFPELVGPLRKELSRLGELLGDHHDLALLEHAIAKSVASPERALASALFDRRRAELERAAFALEARLFAEKPGALARRFGRYFAAART